MSETYTGEVKNGVVVFDQGTPPLPEGTKVYEAIRDHPAIEIVAAERALLLRGVDLYASRPDKSWTLTDCISFFS